MDGKRLGETIRALRVSRGLSLQEVADMLGKNRSTVSRWENGHTEKVKREQIKALAVIFGVDDSVFFQNSRDTIDLKNDTAPCYDFSDESYGPPRGEVSAGLPKLAEEAPWCYDEDSQFFTLKIKGDSMNRRRLCEGDTVLIKKQSYVENGEVAVVAVGDDEATIKTFFKNGNTVTLVPESTNPRHQVQIYDVSKTQIRILGKAVKNYFTL